MKYAFLKQQRDEFNVAVMCRIFGVSRAGFYAWMARKPSARTQETERLKLAIRIAHQNNRRVYGAVRLQPELKKMGFIAGRDKIHRLKMADNLICKQKKAYKITTHSEHTLPVSPNLLQQNFEASVPNQVWTVDISYIDTNEGWLYLAGIKDLFNKEMVGYAMGERMTVNLVGNALFRAVQNKRPAAGLIHHSDRGSQYCSRRYQAMLKQFGMKSSMSGKGNCYDNAPIESFWGSLKNELVHHERYETRAQAEASIKEYIEIFYNRQRRHSSLGNLSPAEFTKRYYQKQRNL